MPERSLGWGRLFAMVLGFIAGFADATGYLRWHAFGANMTGNTVLFAIALTAHGSGAMKPLLPIVAFVCGAMIASALLLRTRPAVPLSIEAVLLAAAAFSHGYVPQLGFLALAMGMQNNAISQFDGVSANTSFVTGDYSRLARAVARAAYGRATIADRRTVAVVAPLIFSYALGALAAAICGHFTEYALLFIVPLVFSLAYAAWRGAAA